MRQLEKWMGVFAIGFVGVAGAGCQGEGEVVVAGPGVVVEEGTGALTVRWLVASTTDPFACFDNFAAEIELALYDVGGALYSVEYAACDEFGLTLELPAGDWGVDATLVDVDRLPVSTTLQLDTRVEPNTEVVIDINFPSDSML